MSEFETSGENVDVESICSETPFAAGPALTQPVSPEMAVGLVEAVLFASADPITKDRLIEVSGLAAEEVSMALEQLRSRGMSDASGVELSQVSNGFQLRTKTIFAEQLRVLRAEPPRRLTGAALETLAIVAYRQPIVRSDIEKIRGVDCTPTLKTLLDRGLVKIVGHQASVGQPALYGTTEEFLVLFGLNSLSELPTLRDLQEVDSDPGEVRSVEESTESATDDAHAPGAELN